MTKDYFVELFDKEDDSKIAAFIAFFENTRRTCFTNEQDAFLRTTLHIVNDVLKERQLISKEQKEWEDRKNEELELECE